jgi:DNA-binding response OmpR family regulator
VRTASDGELAGKLQDFQPEAVLLDIVCPVSTAREWRRLRDIPATRALLLASRVTARRRTAAPRRAGFDYRESPVDPGSILGLLRAHAQRVTPGAQMRRCAVHDSYTGRALAILGNCQLLLLNTSGTWRRPIVCLF